VAGLRDLARRAWTRACRVTLTRSRVTRRKLDAFVGRWADDGPALVVHSVDLDHRRHFPNATVVGCRDDRPADVRTDRTYTALADLPDASRDLVVCTGLLEHLEDPGAFAAQVHRILRPGGRLLVSASSVFPVHGAPHDHHHFTPYGLRHLFADWDAVEALEGTTRPYTTVAVLLQRINLQCDVLPPVRLLNEALVHLLPRLDRAVLRSYDSLATRDAPVRDDLVMPASVVAVVRR
jgi:SAM-dependent methyltransferase